ncbi:hypothetical protein MXB_4609 [Myxobolus squamalis]|nr:hypothetical protein MXB_4609 [Myxobolus squamalis]
MSYWSLESIKSKFIQNICERKIIFHRQNVYSRQLLKVMHLDYTNIKLGWIFLRVEIENLLKIKFENILSNIMDQNTGITHFKHFLTELHQELMSSIRSFWDQCTTSDFLDWICNNYHLTQCGLSLDSTFKEFEVDHFYILDKGLLLLKSQVF